VKQRVPSRVPSRRQNETHRLTPRAPPYEGPDCRAGSPLTGGTLVGGSSLRRPPYIKCEGPVPPGPLLGGPGGTTCPGAPGIFFRVPVCANPRASPQAPRAQNRSRRDPLSLFSHKTVIRPRSVWFGRGDTISADYPVDTIISIGYLITIGYK
jgi:hypothetical protein